MIEIATSEFTFHDGLIGPRVVGRDPKAARRLGIYWLVGVGHYWLQIVQLPLESNVAAGRL